MKPVHSETNVKKYLVISAMGKDRPGIVNQLSKTILDNQGNIEDSRMAVLGGEFSLMLLVAGTWNTIAKIEAMAPALGKKLDLTITVKQTEARPSRLNMVPYMVEVVSMDHPGIVHAIADFCSTREINIEDLNTWTYSAAHTGTPMFTLSMTISVPAGQNIGRLRDEFTQFCDELNLDATLEPARH